jgi:hypothetical protein
MPRPYPRELCEDVIRRRPQPRARRADQGHRQGLWDLRIVPDVGRLIGLHVDDARKLATQSHCHFRVVANPIMTAELDMRRVNVRTEDDIVVDSRPASARPPRPPVYTSCAPDAERRWGQHLRAS